MIKSAYRVLLFPFISLGVSPGALASDTSVGIGWTSVEASHQQSLVSFISLGRIPGDLSLKAGLGVKQYDLDAITIREIDGLERPLSESEHQRRAAFGEVQAQKNWGGFGVGAGWSGTLGRDPYASQRVQLRSEWRSYEWASLVGVALSLEKLTYPQNSFLDRDFVSKRRPELVTRRGVVVSGEQLLLEGTKVRLQMGYNAPSEERPSNKSAEAGVAQAVLGGRVSAHLYAGFLDENRSEKLKNERGYFSVDHRGASLFVEPLLGQLLELSLVSQNEVEVDPRVSEERRVNSRIVGMGVHLREGALKATGGTHVTLVDNEKNLWTIKGEVSWEIGS